MPTDYDDQDSSHYLKSQGKGNERQNSGVISRNEKEMQCKQKDSE